MKAADTRLPGKLVQRKVLRKVRMHIVENAHEPRIGEVEVEPLPGSLPGCAGSVQQQVRRQKLRGTICIKVREASMGMG